MDTQEAIEAFLNAPAFAVVGAGNRMEKYGSKVFACYLQNDRTAYPINPRDETVQGHTAYKSLAELPESVESVSIITPPAVTEKVVEEAITLGVKSVWMQPGAESQAAIENAEANGLSVIANGPCVLVVLGYRE